MIKTYPTIKGTYTGKNYFVINLTLRDLTEMKEISLLPDEPNFISLKNIEYSYNEFLNSITFFDISKIEFQLMHGSIDDMSSTDTIPFILSDVPISDDIFPVC